MATTEEIRMMPIKWFIFICDTCERKVEYNHHHIGGAYNRPSTYKCSLCKNECCSNCSTRYKEDMYAEDAWYDVIACKNCKDKADRAWALALDSARRNEDIEDVFQRMLELIDQEGKVDIDPKLGDNL